MVTSLIGRIFLDAYNKREKVSLSPKEFFTKEYGPLFFGHEKYMMTAGNSPLENPKISWKDMLVGKKPYETPERREERMQQLLNKIDEASEFDASLAIGFRAEGATAGTSGQTCLHDLSFSPDDAYLSWIGAGLGVGVKGGLSILFDHPQILLDIYEGWKKYRELLNRQELKLKGNQINSWNAQWLGYKYSKVTLSSLAEKALNSEDGTMEVGTLPWAELLIALSQHFDDPKMLGYVYNLGQTNTTIGFIPFVLSPIRKAYELYKELFGTTDREKAMRLFGTAYGFLHACQEGAIGLKALEPKGLSPYLLQGKLPVYKPNDTEQIVSFRTYLIWLLAMLNNDTLWEKSQAFASTLQAYTLGGKAAKTGRSNAVKQLLSTNNKKGFITQLTEIIGDTESVDELVEMASTVHAMPSDNVPYLLTLIRFHYAAINNKNQE